jgi:hypothetical protein
MNRVELEPVDRVQITVLMDNVTDPLLVDQEAVARMSWPKAMAGGLPTAGAGVSPDTGVPDALIAEPGFSALVRIEKDGRQRTLLFDTGESAPPRRAGTRAGARHPVPGRVRHEHRRHHDHALITRAGPRGLIV